MRTLRSLVAVVALSGGLLIAPVPAACAGPGPDATLVVDTGGSELLYCVALDAKSVSGLRLIELASQQHGLSYSFGYQGQAVCMLADVGTTEEDCLDGGEPFWGYWRSDGSGGWTWSGTGAGGTVVQDGDVEGWSWGTGNDGSSHQQPPATSHEAVCGPEETPEPDGGGGGKDRGRTGDDDPDGGSDAGHTDGPSEKGRSGVADGASSAGSHAASRGDPASGGDASQERKRPRRDRLTKTKRLGNGRGWTLHINPGPDPTPTPTATPAAAPAVSQSDGPPAAGVLGLIAAIALALVGTWFLKRRHVSQD